MADEFRRGTREDQLRATGCTINAQQVGFDAIARAQVFTLDHLVARQCGFDLANFDDGVAPLHALDGAGNEMFTTLEEALQQRFALGVADLLQNDLLGGLGTDTTKVDGLELFFNDITHGDVGVILACFADSELGIFVFQVGVFNDFPATERFVFAGFAVNDDTDIGFEVHFLAGGLGQGKLQRRKDDFLADVLLTSQRIGKQQNFTGHWVVLSLEYLKLGNKAGLVDIG